MFASRVGQRLICLLNYITMLHKSQAHDFNAWKLRTFFVLWVPNDQRRSWNL